MLKALVNEARLHLDITTMGPLLIKTGYATVIGADMSPVLTYRNGQREIYIPGSSLKGVFRSHIEKVINSIQPRVACNPLATTEEALTKDNRGLYHVSCGARLAKKAAPDKPVPAHEAYAFSCPACRLFGSTSFAGRLAIQDAYLPENSPAAEERTFIEHRDSIAIDRFTGGVGGPNGNAKFDLDVVTEGTTFTTDIYLRNFEIWQLGMLFVIIQDMQDELIRLGSGRSRGLGKIRASISEEEVGRHLGGVVLSTMRSLSNGESDDELWGLGHWLEKEHELYGTQSNDRLALSVPVAHVSRGIRSIRAFRGEALEKLQEQCIEDFVTRIQEWHETQAAPTNARQRR